MDDWFLPGAKLDTETTTIRIRPPEHWTRVILELPRVPPSMNTNEIRSHWTGFQRHKKEWQNEIATMLMVARVRRGGWQRAACGAFLRFQARAPRRDEGNFEQLLNKALGDALVEYRAIPDDDPPHYVFGGVEFDGERGPDRTRIVVFLQPEEG